MDKFQGFSSHYFFRDIVDGEDFYVFFNNLIIVKDTNENGYIVFFPTTIIHFEVSEEDLEMLVPFIKRENSIFLHPDIDLTTYTFTFQEIEMLDCINQEMVYLMPISIYDHVDQDIQKQLIEVENGSNTQGIYASKSLGELENMLSEAVKKEDYGNAAKIRDEIAKR